MSVQSVIASLPEASGSVGDQLLRNLQSRPYQDGDITVIQRYLLIGLDEHEQPTEDEYDLFLIYIPQRRQEEISGWVRVNWSDTGFADIESINLDTIQADMRTLGYRYDPLTWHRVTGQPQKQVTTSRVEVESSEYTYNPYPNQ